MEYKKKDMYLQVESGRSSGWVRVEGSPIPTVQAPAEIGAVTLPVPATPPTAELPLVPAAPPLTAPVQVPAPVPVQVPAPVPVRVPAQTPAQVPEIDQACGFCITLGMAYVPPQAWRNLYEPEDGFARGTIFEELDLPFMGKGDCRND